MTNRAQEVANRLRVARKFREQTLDQVAAATGLAPSTLSRYEKGSRSIPVDTLILLAGHYVVRIAWFFGEGAP